VYTDLHTASSSNRTDCLEREVREKAPLNLGTSIAPAGRLISTSLSRHQNLKRHSHEIWGLFILHMFLSFLDNHSHAFHSYIINNILF
jgi:hypothetical protein